VERVLENGRLRQLLLLRHGQTSWNLEGRWQGWLDVELDAEGTAQAHARARQLAASPVTFVGVASSPLARASATARIVADALGITAVIPDDGLRERNGGVWQGLRRADIDARWPLEFAALRRGELDAPPGGGETTAEIFTRFDAALARIDAELPSGPVVVVTHGGIVHSVATRAHVASSGVLANVGGMWFEYDGGRLHPGAELPPIDAGPAATGAASTPPPPEAVASEPVD
jgi:probable phosphoglycerate mutase